MISIWLQFNCHIADRKCHLHVDIVYSILKTLKIYNYSEPCGMEEKIANHVYMNEQFFLKFHMARSHIEMQRSGIEIGL